MTARITKAFTPGRDLKLASKAHRAERALRDLEFNAVTQADKKRIAYVWVGLEALDQEQAALKAHLEYLCDEYGDGGGNYTKAIIEELRAAIAGQKRKVKP